MKKQLVIIGIVAILVSVGLSGCNSTDQTNEQEQTPEDLVIGNWFAISNDGERVDMTFYKNRSVYSIGRYSSWGEYQITKSQIIFVNPMDGSERSAEYSFSDNNQKLIIINPNGDNTVLTRK